MNRSLIDKLAQNPRYAQQLAAAREPKAPKRNKYRAEPVVVDGERFDSKLEYRVYQRLCAGYGERNVMRQVTLRCGKNTMRIDFMIIEQRHDADRVTVSFRDAKGMETRDWTARANHLEDAHGIRVLQEKY